MPGHVSGVASRYAWDVVETLWRTGVEPVCVDNVGGADPALPGLADSTGRAFHGSKRRAPGPRQ
jgi:hypothetical protein